MEKFDVKSLSDKPEPENKKEAIDKLLNYIEEGTDDRIYAIKRLDSNRDFVVCDGYKYEFFFSSGDKKARRKKNNIFNCKGEYKKSPNTAYIIDVLESIGKVLIPEGVYKDCFLLELD